MKREELLNQIAAYIPYNEQEAADRELILHWIQDHDDAFTRQNKVAHITAGTIGECIEYGAKFLLPLLILVDGDVWHLLKQCGGILICLTESNYMQNSFFKDNKVVVSVCGVFFCC